MCKKGYSAIAETNTLSSLVNLPKACATLPVPAFLAPMTDSWTAQAKGTRLKVS